MLKMIGGLLIGMILAGALLLGPFSPTPATGQSDDSIPTETLTVSAETYRQALTSLLQKAGDEIQDKDIKQFYQKLLREYELEELAPETASAESSSLTETLPDIQKIAYAAITLPLQEAGKNIRDKDIKQFYYKLLKDAGWTIEPD